ncbi:MAG TPA: hypothetical protein PLN38_15080 [Chitinophagales bacterium]|nr:hypothetical protein [Chitinophagales bacterium]
MFDTHSQNIILAALGVVGIEIVHDVHVQEWTKIFLQAAIALATLWKVFKPTKEKDEQE